MIYHTKPADLSKQQVVPRLIVWANQEEKDNNVIFAIHNDHAQLIFEGAGKLDNWNRKYFVGGRRFQ